MQTIKASENVVLKNVQRWQEEKNQRTKRQKTREFKQHFNSVGDQLDEKERHAYSGNGVRV